MRYKIEYLSKVTEKYFKEAKNCLKNKDYIAALIMYGSVLEALLLAMCFAYPDEVRETKTYKSIKNILKKRKGGFF